MHPNEALVRALYAARERGDLEAVAGLLAPDIDWHEPYEYLGHIRGRDAVLEALRETVAATHGSFRITLHDLLASDQHAVALVEWRAERDGRHLAGREVAVYHVDDGRVSEVWFYTEDTHAVAEMLAPGI
ncbi:MAG TPA: nuclear transport factor 2 family protein [Candidatus Limnocylindrales bacterium]|nr:nuclear transport factor 2 family protein [Candidatus Limnocylindrales bacterium]